MIPDFFDTRLHPFLLARLEMDEDEAMLALLEDVRPTVMSSLRHRVLLFNSDPDLADDLWSSVQEKLITQLRACKNSFLEDPNGPGKAIRHFPALALTIATNEANAHIKQKYPRRASLKNQIMYVIRETKDARGQERFALWVFVEERLCGFHFWHGRAFTETDLHRQLHEDPRGAMHLALPQEDARHVTLPRVLEALWNWLGAPARFNDVVNTTAHWRDIHDHSDVSLTPVGPDGEDTPSFEPISPTLTPEERVFWRDYLQRVWNEIAQLPVGQRAALLLNLCDPQGRGVLGMVPVLGVATLDDIARVLGCQKSAMAALWEQLPLDDKAIAARLDCPVPQVAIWRLRARRKLEKVFGGDA